MAEQQQRPRFRERVGGFFRNLGPRLGRMTLQGLDAIDPSGINWYNYQAARNQQGNHPIRAGFIESTPAIAFGGGYNPTPEAQAAARRALFTQVGGAILSPALTGWATNAAGQAFGLPGAIAANIGTPMLVDRGLNYAAGNLFQPRFSGSAPSAGPSLDPGSYGGASPFVPDWIENASMPQSTNMYPDQPANNQQQPQQQQNTNQTPQYADFGPAVAAANWGWQTGAIRNLSRYHRANTMMK